LGRQGSGAGVTTAGGASLRAWARSAIRLGILDEDEVAWASFLYSTQNCIHRLDCLFL
jgi:hypothetical protein